MVALGGLRGMPSHRMRAMALRGAPHPRCSLNALATGRSIRLAAATTRPAAARAALLGGVCLGAVAVLVPNAAQAQQGPFLYVPNGNSNNVSVIDTPTNTTVPPTISVGTTPFTAAVRGDEALVYVTNINNATVSVINTATNAVVATIGVGVSPTAIAVSPDGTRA